MNSSNSKKQRKILRNDFKEKLQKTAEQLVNDRILKEIDHHKNQSKIHAKQRDWFILLSIAEFIVIIGLSLILIFWK